jgi:hypothetical protein
MDRPTLEDIEATVERLEARLGASPDPEVQALLHRYHKLDARFRADLSDPRDLALSRGAALMLIRFVAEMP